MKITLFFLSLVFALCVAQDYSMGTREAPKPDLSPDEKLVIQNTVGFPLSTLTHSLFRRSVSRRPRMETR